MKKQRAYRFRIYPDREQEKLIRKTFGCCRFVYNRMLSERKEIYEKTGKTVRLTPARYKKKYIWLKEVDSLALANAQLHLEAAYRKFFREEKAGFPKFKSKQRSFRTVSGQDIRCITGRARRSLPGSRENSPIVRGGAAVMKNRE